MMVNFLLNIDNVLLIFGNQVYLFMDGYVKFDQFIKDIDQVKWYIYVEYYIFVVD